MGCCFPPEHGRRIHNLGTHQGVAATMTFILLLLLLTQVSAHDLDGSVYCSEDVEAQPDHWS